MLRALLAVHMALSLIGIAAGLVEIAGWLLRKRWPTVTAIFLWTTLATSLTGFPLPAKQLLPSHVIGVISVIILNFALVAVNRQQLAGRWRATYVLTAATAQYLNMFVLVVQAFRRVRR